VPGTAHEAGINRTEFNDARIFVRVSEVELEERIEALALSGRLSKIELRRALQLKKPRHTRSWTEPEPVASRQEPEVVMLEEDEALVHLYDCATRNPEHYLKGRYTKNEYYQQLVSNLGNWKLIRASVKSLLEELDANRPSA
jgi:hypothetical protein